MAISDWIIQNSLGGTAQTYVPVGTNQMLLISFSNGGGSSAEVPSWLSSVGLSEMKAPVYNLARYSYWNYSASKCAIDNAHSLSVPAGGAGIPTTICMVQIA